MSGVDYRKLYQFRQRAEALRARMQPVGEGLEALAPLQGKSQEVQEAFMLTITYLQQADSQLEMVESAFNTFAPPDPTMGPDPSDPLWWFTPQARPMVKSLMKQTGVGPEALTNVTLINMERLLDDCERYMTSAEDYLTKAQA